MIRNARKKLILILLIIQNVNGGIHNCDYFTYEDERNVELFCQLISYDLSLQNKDEVLKFYSDSYYYNNANVGGFKFGNVGNVDFVPKFSDLKKSFVNLEGFIIQHGNLPTLTNNLFDESYKDVDHIELQSVRLVDIEENAFQHMINLKFILLHNNRIRSLPYNIFKNNKKLEHINLSNNQINLITPRLLAHLKNLNQVYFSYNECINKDFSSQSQINSQELPKKLKVCYENCKNSQEYCDFPRALDTLKKDDSKFNKMYVVVPVVTVGGLAAIGSGAYFFVKYKRRADPRFSIF